MSYELVDARHGRFLVNSNDTYVGRSLREYGEWSEPEVELFGRLLRQGDVVVEAGANVGSHTVFLSRAVGETGKVVAFEPQRLTHQLLCANLALNECFNVDARREAVGETAGSIEVPFIHPRHSFNYGAVSLQHSWEGLPHDSVPLVRLDDSKFDRLDLIKADIEGFEPALLRGAQTIIAQHRPVVYLELSPRPIPRGNRDELTGIMRSLGYQCYYFFTPLYNLNNFKLFSEDIFHGFSMDMLCVPSEKWKVEGLTEAYPQDTAFTINDQGTGISHSCSSWENAQITRV